MKKALSAVLMLVMLASILSSCVTKTHVTFNTDTPGADVYINGEYIGKTPVTKKLSNSIWEDPDILIRKDGYQDMHFQVQKEVKTVNLICGLLLWWPSLFWVHGPKAQQHYMLTPIK